MLPIAHALQVANAKGYIQITRVAGSSAGAICAALLAGKADFEKARGFIVDEGPKRLPHLLRWSSKIPGSKLRLALAVNQARKGIPLLRNETLITFLKDLLKTSGVKCLLVEHSSADPGGMKLAITGSDLSLGKGAIFETGNLLDAVVHSSAIPFALRGWEAVKTSPYVDGGVCENLPAEYLLKFEDDDGPVFAVSLTEESDASIPSNAIEYCLQLISASMNHNIERAKDLIGHSQVLEARTNLKSFDFDGAIKNLSDDANYESCYDNALNQILRYSQLHATVQAVSPFYLSGRVSAPKIMRSIFRVFENSLKTAEGWSCKQASFLVRADCLKLPLDKRIRLWDQVIRIAKIRAKEGGLVCCSSSAAMTKDGSIVPTAWSCFNETQQKELMIQAVPAENVASRTRGKMREVLLFFENPRQAIAAGDEITISSYYSVGHNMLGLENAGSDYIDLGNPHPIPVEVADVVLAWPIEFGPLALAVDTSLGDRKASKIADNELQAVYGGKFSRDFGLLGMRTENLAPGERFRVIFTRSRRVSDGP